MSGARVGEAEEPGVTATKAQLRRLFGERSSEFAVAGVDRAAAGEECFELSVDGSGRPVLAGTSGFARAAGLRWYLRERCGAVPTWDADVDLPAVLPPPSDDGAVIRRQAAFAHRLHYNVCTFGYTTAFWDWPRWEREIDLLALRGVDLPLLLVGHEAVWQRVLRRFGLSDETIRGFLGGPAYLPWTTMGNVAGWCGPMSQDWIDRHAELGARIAARQRELGMRPVLPGFAGHVPAELVAGGRVTASTLEWCGFTTYVMDPNDPAYVEMSAAFIEEQRAVYGGTDHHYAADPFIEAAPSVRDEGELAAVATAVYSGMRAADPQAVWVFQSWPFSFREDYWTPERIAAFLGAVPDDRMLILDLWSEHRPITGRLGTDKPWLWCMLNNFGGRPGLHGSLATVAGEPGAAVGTGAIGVGATMEDDRTNPLVYELLACVGWAGGVADLDAWLATWVRGRCPEVVGTPAHDALLEAWRLLRDAVYSSSEPGPPGPVVLRRPVVDGDLVPASWLASEAPRPAEPSSKMLRAWRLMAGALPPEASAGPAGRDLADVTFTVLAAAGDAAQATAAAAYRAGDVDRFEAAAARFLATIDDLETVLATRPEYLLGRWIADARAWGDTDEQRRSLELQARRILTTWGAAGSELTDYARRGWAGLLSTYYRPRWVRWVEVLRDSLASGASPAAGDFAAEMVEFEERWARDDAGFATEPVGDTLSVVRRIHAAYDGEAGDAA